MTPGSKGFHACGQYYVMGDKQIPLIQQLAILANEINKNAINNKLCQK